MKFVSLSIIVMLLGCQRNPYQNFIPLLQKAPTGKVMLISCVRCNCIIEDLNRLIASGSTALNGYTIMGDTNCLKNLSRTNQRLHVSQSSIDSISMDIYNMLISNGRTIKLVRTEDSEKMEEMLRNFE